MPSLEVLIPEEVLVHCFWCERPHRGEHPLSVCPSCTVRLTTMRLLEMSGSDPLTAEAIDDALKRKAPSSGIARSGPGRQRRKRLHPLRQQLRRLG
jgi:hypothetical protein